LTDTGRTWIDWSAGVGVAPPPARRVADRAAATPPALILTSPKLEPMLANLNSPTDLTLATLERLPDPIFSGMPTLPRGRNHGDYVSR